MARDQVAVTCPPGVWTQLTNSDATAISFQVLTGSVQVRATVGATAPGAQAAGYVYHASVTADSQTLAGLIGTTVATLAKVSGANRLYARPINGRPAVVIVDHA
jgi:hypothetical protein